MGRTLNPAAGRTDPAPMSSGTTAWTRRHKLVAGLTAATSLISAALFYAGPTQHKTTVWMSGTAIMLALMYVGVFLFRRASIKPWLFVVGGLTSAYFGMFFMMYGHWFGLSFGQPSVLDALSLANYPLAAIGAFIMLGRLHVRTGINAIVETITLTLAGGLLIWVFVGVRATEAADSALINRLVAGAYPMGNVLLLAILAAVAVRLKERPGAMILLSFGFAGNLAADLISSFQRLEGTYQPGGWVDFGWLLCFAGLSMAPAWPDTESSSVRESVDVDNGQVTPGRLAIMLAALFAGPAILVGRLATGADVPDTVATIGTVVVFAMALVRIALYNRELRISQDALRTANSELAQADRDKQQLLWRINRAVEEERSRIAAEIHDRPVQELAAVGYQVELATIALMTNDVERASEICDEVADGLSEQLTALRQLMVEIRPPVLDERGLLGALADAGMKFERSNGVKVCVDGDDARIEQEAETVLYRVAQESLTNIAKHADAEEVSISVETSQDLLSMTVSDDGVGFDTDDLDKMVADGHYGLAGMGERMSMLGGRIDVTSSPGSGTTLTFTMPLIKTDETEHRPAERQMPAGTGALATTGAE